MANRDFKTLMLRRFRKNRLSALAALVVVLLFLVGIFAPWIALHEPTRQDYNRVLEPPSRTHWFGTDELGRCVFSRVVYGARISLVVSVLAVGLGASVGVSIGMISGYYGGMIDTLLGRLVDVQLSFPGILIAMLIAAALRAGVFSVVVAVGIYSIPTFSRLARGAALSVKQREYVEAARAAGAEEVTIIIRHVLLNSFGPILVYATLLLGSAILTAASLSFLGVGVPPPTPEWGAMINSARVHMRHAPHIVIFPGLAIFLTVLSFNILGDALRDTLDPKAIGSA